MINKSFKAHPIIVLGLMKPYLFILILPLIRAVVQYFTKGQIDGLLALEILAFGFILATAILGWISISVTVNDRYIAVKKGFLIKSCAVIELSRLSSISLKQGMLDCIFNSVSCAINTEAGTPQKSDFNIKMSVCDAKSLYKTVYKTEKMQIVKFSAFRIALLSATTSSAATGIIVGVPIINKTSDLVGIAISDMLLNEINNVSSKFDNVFPPVVNTATIILLIAYGVSFVISFFKNVNFKLKSGKKSVEVQSGLVVRKKTIFKKAKINNICFEQPPLMRILRRYSMRASIGGYGDTKGEKAVLVPVAKHSELQISFKTHFPFFKLCNNAIIPKKTKRNLNRFLFVSELFALAIVGLGVATVIILPYFDRLTLFLMAVALGIDLYYASICYHNYKCGIVRLDDFILASGSTGFTIRELYCEKNKIGLIKISQTLADKREKTCKLKFVVRSESADGVKIKNLDLKTVIQQLNKTFKLNLNE